MRRPPTKTVHMPEGPPMSPDFKSASRSSSPAIIGVSGSHLQAPASSFSSSSRNSPFSRGSAGSSEERVIEVLTDSVVVRPGPMDGHQTGFQAHHEYIIFDRLQAYPAFIVRVRREDVQDT